MTSTDASFRGDPYLTPHERPLQGGGGPWWADERGTDEFGDWADLVVGSDPFGEKVVQRFRWMPPGGFVMGSDPRLRLVGYANQTPIAVVIQQGFWLADTPVTQRCWSAVVGGNPSYYPPGDDASLWRRPVDQVSFDMALDFLDRLRTVVHERTPEAPTPFECRLPREHEWEWSCRALTTDAHYGIADGLSMCDIAWCTENSGFRTKPVALLRPNRWGLYDMLGNVAEWCDDEYRKVADPTRAIPPPSQRRFRVLRGGTWADPPDHISASARSFQLPGLARLEVGFRIAVSHAG